MAVGRIKRLLAVAGAAGCLGLLGGPTLAQANPGRGPVTEQGPSGSGGEGVAPPLPDAGTPTGGPLAIPGSETEPADASGERPPAESRPPTDLGTGSSAPGPVPGPAAGTESGTGSSGADSGDVAQWQPLDIPGRSQEPEPVDTGEPAPVAAPRSDPAPVAEPLGPVGLGTALGTILATGSAAVGSAAAAPLGVTGSAALGTGSAVLGTGSAAVGSAGLGVGTTGSAALGTGSAALGTGSAAVGSAGVGVLGTGSAALGSAGVGVLGTGSAATGSAGAGILGTGSAGVGSAAVGSAATGSAAAGSAATGSAAVGSAGVGSAAPLLLLLLPLPPVPAPPVGPPLALPAPGGGAGGGAAAPALGVAVPVPVVAPVVPGTPAAGGSAPEVVAAPPNHAVRPTNAEGLLPEPKVLSVIGGLIALAIAGTGSAVMSYHSAAQAQARVDAARAEFFGTGA
ncbi:hypothetical protein ABZV91_22150 [Nocardia sp. NPDC004568]|uniref:hypothetical protein n=1 Tax=Nocardia sp. NPDC004568 TaxID=3154551 RepID=UPI0033A57144